MNQLFELIRTRMTKVKREIAESRVKRKNGQRQRREGGKWRSFLVGSCQAVLRLLTVLLITFGQTDKCVVVCFCACLCGFRFSLLYSV